MGNMGTATEFLGEIAHGYHTYLITVLFTEQCHRTCLLCFLNTHDLCCYLQICCDLFIDDLLNLGKLFLCHCLSIAEVKSGALAVLIRALLMYLITQHLLKRRL